jgi:hypothetical protein
MWACVVSAGRDHEAHPIRGRVLTGEAFQRMLDISPGCLKPACLEPSPSWCAYAHGAAEQQMYSHSGVQTGTEGPLSSVADEQLPGHQRGGVTTAALAGRYTIYPAGVAE